MEGLVEGQCERVFGALVKGVGVGGGQQGASVNLVRGPVGVEGMWVVDGAGEGEGFTGMFFFFCFWFCWLFFFSLVFLLFLFLLLLLVGSVLVVLLVIEETGKTPKAAGSETRGGV